MSRFKLTFLFSIAMIGAALAGPKVEFDTTMGKFVVELNEEKAPKTVANFLKYVDRGHYDGIVFHRVIENFMIQTGGFEKKEDGQIEQKEVDESIKNEANNGLKNDKGTLAMARTGDPHSASAQFFINHKDNAFLNHSAETQRGWGYAVFGKVVEGEDVIDTIAQVATATKTLNARLPTGAISAQPMENVPIETIVIKSAKRVSAE